MALFGNKPKKPRKAKKPGILNKILHPFGGNKRKGKPSPFKGKKRGPHSEEHKKAIGAGVKKAWASGKYKNKKRRKTSTQHKRKKNAA